MLTRYYEGEKSVGLMPIVLAISAATAVCFGMLYFTCSHQLAATGADDDAGASTQQVQPIQPGIPETDTSKRHGHV
jgi:hypothetical protein